MKYGIYAALAGIALMAAAPASALTTVSACSPSYPNPDAQACAGYYTTNLLNANDAADQLTALQTIGYTGSFDGTKAGWNTLVANGDVLGTISGTTIDFGKMLYGITYIGAHFGNITDPVGTTDNNVSVFWKFDFGTTGASSVSVASSGLSDAALYSTGTGGGPEPATWAVMLVGFAGVGFAMRRSKRNTSEQLLQLA